MAYNNQMRTRPNNGTLCDVTVRFNDGETRQYFDISHIDRSGKHHIELFAPCKIVGYEGASETVAMIDTRVIDSWYWVDHPRY